MSSRIQTKISITYLDVDRKALASNGLGLRIHITPDALQWTACLDTARNYLVKVL